MTQIKGNFIYPDLTEAHYRFGSSPLVGTPLREDGDWRPYAPPEEEQNINGIESSACYVEGQQHAIATIEEETFGEIDNNYSARFNALLSDGTEYGGDPIKGADSIRHDGLIPDYLMPFSEEIKTWDDFHSWLGVDETMCRRIGQEYRAKRKLGHDIVVERNDSLEAKYSKMKQALKYSPLPLSVSAWFEKEGEYYKPEGMIDNHMVVGLYIDEKNRLHIRDTYQPFNKILEPNYNIDFAMRWTVEKRTEPLNKATFWKRWITYIVSLF